MLCDDNNTHSTHCVDMACFVWYNYQYNYIYDGCAYNIIIHYWYKTISKTCDHYQQFCGEARNECRVGG